ncbi:MAG: polysaccharide pyruvyl transferase family protein [Gammaproteobacteria bacterium]|nr:polysaccharide pyruvyl transferase family protein [Gammaproteobacteria bacterium]
MPLRVYTYRSRRFPAGNFGDVISPWLIERVFDIPARAADVGDCDLVAAGSVLDLVMSRRWRRWLHGKFELPYLWGTGTARPGPLIQYPRQRLLALRGPSTAQRCGCAEGELPLGDPVWLLAELQLATPTTRKINVIPHISHAQDREMRNLAIRLGAGLIDLGADIDSVCASIKASTLVISSSLHGLLGALALGIPAIWCTPDSGRGLHPWKFSDALGAVDTKMVCHRPETLATLSMDALYDLATQVSTARIAERCDALRSAFSPVL